MRRRDFARQLKLIKLVVLDFDGVFTDNRVLVFQDGTEGVWCSRGDGMGIDLLRKAGIPAIVISTEKNSVVSARCRKLKLSCIQGCDDKLSVLRREAKRIGVPLKAVAYMGNDVNDKLCLRAVGFPVCVRDAHPDVARLAKYVTHNRGGYGAVRELCDMLLEAKR